MCLATGSITPRNENEWVDLIDPVPRTNNSSALPSAIKKKQLVGSVTPDLLRDSFGLAAMDSWPRENPPKMAPKRCHIGMRNLHS